MKTSETIVEFVVIGVLAAAAGYWISPTETWTSVRDVVQAADLLWVLPGVYLVGLVVNAAAKKLLRPQDRWIRARVVQEYAGSRNLRSLVPRLGTGLQAHQCLDSLTRRPWIERLCADLFGHWTPFRQRWKANLGILESSYKLVSQLPFYAMHRSEAATDDISKQRSLVRISRSVTLVALLASVGAAAYQQWWKALVATGGLVLVFYTFRQRARWYALDAVKYALANERQDSLRAAPRVIVFDVGGVICRDIREPLFKWLERKVGGIGTNWENASREFWEQVSTKPMQERELNQRLREALRRTDSRVDESELSDKELCQQYRSLSVGDENVLELISELRSAGIQTVLLSNHTSTWFEGQDDRYGLRERFDRVFLSYELGQAKPHLAVFEKIDEELSADGAGGIIYVDDRGENCTAAEMVGWEAVRFTDAPTLRSVLHGFGMPLTESKMKQVRGERKETMTGDAQISAMAAAAGVLMALGAVFLRVWGLDAPEAWQSYRLAVLLPGLASLGLLAYVITRVVRTPFEGGNHYNVEHFKTTWVFFAWGVWLLFVAILVSFIISILASALDVYPG